MRNVAIALTSTAAALMLSGCPIWLESEEVSWTCAGDCAAICVVDAECPSGYVCDGGACSPTYFCDWDGSCPAGFVCDDRDTCVPSGPVPCEDDLDCPNGYCNEGGFCTNTGPCWGDADCIVYGPGLACDDRGLCVPEEPPCPDGECGCTSDEECAGEGRLCISSRCTDALAICLFNFECGEDGLCVDNECHSACLNGECPVGQDCLDGLCLAPAAGMDGCVWDEDCGTGGDVACINATCHPLCGSDAECGERESCSGGVCRADGAPLRECGSDAGECAEGMECLRGVCRMPCVGPINCEDQGEMTECYEGYCAFAAELDAVCLRASDCADGASCVGGSCLTLAE